MEWSLIKNLNLYSKEEIRCLNPINIAYIGDCVYELYLRSHVMKKFGNINSNKLHLEVIKYVNAGAQRAAYFKVKELLADDEKIYFKKGRNAKTKTIPKNSSIFDYRVSTGFETIIGYLYITGNFSRLDLIVGEILNCI